MVFRSNGKEFLVELARYALERFLRIENVRTEEERIKEQQWAFYQNACR